MRENWGLAFKKRRFLIHQFVICNYGVTDIALPPPENITGTKAIAVPSAMEAKKIDEHSEEANELSYVSADNSLTVDPNYRIKGIGVYTPNDRPYADALKLAEHKNQNRILVEIGNKYFFFRAFGQGNNDPRDIDTNFNTLLPIHPSDEIAGVIQPSLPITITADFEGLLTLTIMYTAVRRDKALDAWKVRTYAAIVKGYNTKKQAYDQALAVAQAKVQSETEAQTFQLREDQYRSIEVTELKRGCIDLLSQNSAAGHTSITFETDGTPRIVHDEAEGSQHENWRSPLANGTVAEFFEQAFEWDQMTYEFYPYYWAADKRWKELAQATGSDPVFAKFLQAGSASVVVPVRPGYERPVMLFLKTGRIWGGHYLSLFTDPQVLEVYEDIELAEQIDPPEQTGEPWEVRLPTTLVMLQQGDTLPKFPEEDTTAEEGLVVVGPTADVTVPF